MLEHGSLPCLESVIFAQFSIAVLEDGDLQAFALLSIFSMLLASVRR